MNSSTTTLTSDQWQILFHETMAALLRAQESLKHQFGFWGVLYGLWRCSRDLKALQASLKAISELPDGTLSQEFIQSQIPQLQELLRSIEGLMDTCKLHGFTNRSLTSLPLAAIRFSGEYVADYLDTLKMSIDPEVIRAIEEGRSQIERGEFVEMERIS
ncbi:MAG: hypothetical protein ABI165_17620 [Bryobacteraceae bacterium]